MRDEHNPIPVAQAIFWLCVLCFAFGLMGGWLAHGIVMR